MNTDTVFLNSSPFGKITKLESLYPTPSVLPPEGHPRVLFTAEGRRRILSDLNAPENAYAKKAFLELSEVETDGTVAPPSVKSYNIDYRILAVIESKAFRYALTGEKQYGIAARDAIFRYMRTVVITADLPDHCRACGYVMYIAACVYDWCYDLMSDENKRDIIAACETIFGPDMEIGFPPVGQGSITGHGMEAQLMRDWLSLAIASFDEFPDIYYQVGGRIFAEFRDSQEFYLASGSHWQGSAYGPYRYYFNLFLYAIYDGMTDGRFRFYSDNLWRAGRTFLQYIRPDNQALRIGDDFNEHGGTYSLSMYGVSSFYAGNFGKDPILKGFAKKILKDFSVFSYSNSNITPVMFLIFNRPSIGCQDIDYLPPVCVNGSPLGSIIARSSRGDDAVMVYMKVGEAYSANHEHKDAGCFQIFYRGILASDSGYYDSYGSVEDYAYNKQTISSNTLLIVNPALTDNGKWIYSGGQHNVGEYNSENRNLAVWLSKPTSRQAKMTACEVLTTDGIFCDRSGRTPLPEKTGGGYRYAYLAGDLTNAYDSETVESVHRSMVSVMTENPDIPMVFVTYDDITARDASFTKKYLLHCQTEPAVGKDYARIDSHGGRLYVQSPKNDMDYTSFGGYEREYLINGTQYSMNRKRLTEDTICEYGWGRIELTPKYPDKRNAFVTVMYVTDADKDITRAVSVENDAVIGASVAGVTVVFAKTADVTSFTCEAAGKLYVAGLTAGLWRVGGQVCRVNEGGLLSAEVDGVVRISR